MKKVFFLVFMCLMSWNAVAASCSYNTYADCKSATESCYWDTDNDVCSPCGKNAVPNAGASHCNCIDGYAYYGDGSAKEVSVGSNDCVLQEYRITAYGTSTVYETYFYDPITEAYGTQSCREGDYQCNQKEIAFTPSIKKKLQFVGFSFCQDPDYDLGAEKTCLTDDIRSRLFWTDGKVSGNFADIYNSNFDIYREYVCADPERCAVSYRPLVYSHWDFKKYDVEFCDYVNNVLKCDDDLSMQCTYNEDCVVSGVVPKNNKSGYVFTGWKPESYLIKIEDNKIIEPNYNSEFTDNKVQLVAQYSTCPEGFYCENGVKNECPAGYYCPVGSSEPQDCPAGFYCEGGVKKDCPVGFYCENGVKISYCSNYKEKGDCLSAEYYCYWDDSASACSPCENRPFENFNGVVSVHYSDSFQVNAGDCPFLYKCNEENKDAYSLSVSYGNDGGVTGISCGTCDGVFKGNYGVLTFVEDGKLKAMAYTTLSYTDEMNWCMSCGENASLNNAGTQCDCDEGYAYYYYYSTNDFPKETDVGFNNCEKKKYALYLDKGIEKYDYQDKYIGPYYYDSGTEKYGESNCVTNTCDLSQIDLTGVIEAKKRSFLGFEFCESETCEQTGGNLVWTDGIIKGNLLEMCNNSGVCKDEFYMYAVARWEMKKYKVLYCDTVETADADCQSQECYYEINACTVGGMTPKNSPKGKEFDGWTIDGENKISRITAGEDEFENNQVRLLPLYKDCPEGYFCPGGGTEPQKCPEGDYCPAGSSKPQDCPDGYYCPAGSGEPQDCPPGYYCKDGVKIECQEGYCCSETGETQQYEAGQYCDESGSPQDCQEGYYCEGGVKKECPEGYYCPAGSSEPQACPEGHYCPAGSSEPQACLEGYCCSETSQTEYGTGQYCDESGSPQDCPPGYYCKESKKNSCPVGTTSEAKKSDITSCYASSATSFEDKHEHDQPYVTLSGPLYVGGNP